MNLQYLPLFTKKILGFKSVKKASDKIVVNTLWIFFLKSQLQQLTETEEQIKHSLNQPHNLLRSAFTCPYTAFSLLFQPFKKLNYEAFPCTITQACSPQSDLAASQRPERFLPLSGMKVGNWWGAEEWGSCRLVLAPCHPPQTRVVTPTAPASLTQQPLCLLPWEIQFELELILPPYLNQSDHCRIWGHINSSRDATDFQSQL